MAAMGHPLVGDLLYAPGGGIVAAAAAAEGTVDQTDRDAMPGDTGYCLHAWQIKMRHPTTGAFDTSSGSQNL